MIDGPGVELYLVDGALFEHEFKGSGWDCCGLDVSFTGP